MSDQLPTPVPTDPASDSPPSWKRIGEFLRNILRLERAVESLKGENRDLREQVKVMQRQVDEQSGKLLILAEFVSKALDDRIATRAEDAAIRAVERMRDLASPVRRSGKAD